MSYYGVGSSGYVLTAQGAGVQPIWAAPAGGSSHNLLDGSVHSDTVAQSVSRGSLIVGNSTPKWDELVIGGASTLLKSDGTDASWGTVNLLSAFHGDTTAGTVARGDVITGQGGTPKWTRLAKGTAGQVLRMDGTATDVEWGTVSGEAGGGGQKYLFLHPYMFKETASSGSAASHVIRGSTDGSFGTDNDLSGTLDRNITSYFVVPQGYSAIAAIKFYYVDASTGGQIVIKVGFDVLNDGDDAAASVTFATKNTITTPGTSNVLDIVSLNIPSVSLAAGNVVKVIIQRPASSDGDDTYATAIPFVGLLLEFTLS
jgi:hypothetical protein